MIKQSLIPPPALAALSAAADNEHLQLPSGTKIAIKRWGRGIPVLCLHAVGHASGDFSDLSSRLKTGFELIAIDWPAMGKSPSDGGLVRAQRFSNIIFEVIDALDLKKPFLIGHSIGGAAALIAASASPERFSGLVLCNAGGLAELNVSARFVIRRMVAFFRAGKNGAWWFPVAFSVYYRLFILPAKSAEAQRKRIVAAYFELSCLLEEAWEGFGEPAGDLRAHAPKLKLPVWLAWAKSDKFVSWSRAKQAVATMPHHHVTLFNGGHCAFLEDPAAFAAGFERFTNAVRKGQFL